MIEVRLFASFREGREKILFLDHEQHPDALSILSVLDIPVDDVAILLINGRHSKAGNAVKDGDVVALFPPVGGG